MSRTKYLTHLERQIDASRKTIDDLTKENYELRILLSEASKLKNQTPCASKHK